MLQCSMNDNIDLGELFETLSLDKQFVEPKTPPFTGYGPYPQYWNWYGGPWPVNGWNARRHVADRTMYMDVEYRNTEGQYHRIHGPSYISKLFEVQAWYKDGKRHRVGGPAYIHRANMVWFFEGKPHNLEGPAVIEGGGPKQYWIHGERYTAKQYKWEIARRKRKGLI